CLHFQDDDLLKNTVILKPEWGTGAVYKVLDNDSIKRNDGHFTRGDLTNIWQKYMGMHGELLRLMMKFSLCYELPGGGQYIAPQLLPEKAKKYPWEAQNNLLLRYTYTFMPKGILSRFIVTMHSDIEDQRVWRHGVVLAKDGARAEVIEDYQEREIRIRVAGANQRDLLTIIVEHLERIHASFQQLRYERLIPCRCAQCGTDPHFYSYQVLKRFAADRQEYIQCPKSYIMVDVRGLLDEVRDKRAAPLEKTSFDFTQKRKLVELLLACPSIQNTQARHALAAELPPDIANTVKASDNPQVHVLYIINACMNHADGIDVLFKTLDFFDGQTKPFQALMRTFTANREAGETGFLKHPDLSLNS
ncbi:MAG: GTPase, partial [Gammaproteobacteria bacterium]|nr:GTPase [Gammaproteobacteria bacterium]